MCSERFDRRPNRCAEFARLEVGEGVEERADSMLAVIAGERPRVGPHLNQGNVAHEDVALHDDILELFQLRLRRRIRPNRKSNNLGGSGRSDLQREINMIFLTFECFNDIKNRQVVGSKFLGVEGEMNLLGGLADELDSGDASQQAQFVLEGSGGVIAEVEEIATAICRRHIHNGDRLRHHFPGGGAPQFHQHRQRGEMPATHGSGRAPGPCPCWSPVRTRPRDDTCHRFHRTSASRPGVRLRRPAPRWARLSYRPRSGRPRWVLGLDDDHRPRLNGRALRVRKPLGDARVPGAAKVTRAYPQCDNE